MLRTSTAMTSSQRVLGIDPGVARLGWAILESQGPRIHLVGCGCLETVAGVPAEKRLLQLSKKLNNIIVEYQPSVMAVEKLFFSKNVTTGIAVGQARGVVLLAAANAGLALREFTPTTVKQSVTGDGHADKRQMGRMVQLLLKLRQLPKHDDTTDAIAIALCAASTNVIH